MKKNQIHFSILYLIIFILVCVIITSNKNIILNNTKIILKNMDETTEVSNLNNTLNLLHASDTEYAKYIQISKTNLASAITNAGIETDENADFETMIANVSNILSQKTSDATATADEILTGQTAYVNGEKITGTMADRGTLNWNPSSSTSYSVPAGYYSGGTLSTANAYNEGLKNGVSFIAFGVGKTGRDTITSSIYKYNSEYISVSGTTATVKKAFTATVQLVDSGLGSSWVRFYKNGSSVLSGTSSKQISFNVGDTFYSQSYQDPSINYSGSSFVVYK